MYFDKLDDTLNKYNNSACHRTTKMNVFDVKSSTYIHFGAEKNDKDQKRFLKNAKVYTPSWSGEIFVIKKVKKTLCHGSH